jgi:hypothetical protein
MCVCHVRIQEVSAPSGETLAKLPLEGRELTGEKESRTGLLFFV